MARPSKPINLEELEKLAAMHATDDEMAAWFGVSRETFNRRKPKLLDTIERGKARGRVSLRRAQYNAALAGDRTILIWLGKQLLGQKDETKTEHSGEIAVTDADGARERLYSRIAGLAAARGTEGSAREPQ